MTIDESIICGVDGSSDSRRAAVTTAHMAELDQLDNDAATSGACLQAAPASSAESETTMRQRALRSPAPSPTRSVCA
jgi:hypothetical protein